jgi:hypothetical protein
MVIRPRGGWSCNQIGAGLRGACGGGQGGEVAAQDGMRTLTTVARMRHHSEHDCYDARWLLCVARGFTDEWVVLFSAADGRDRAMAGEYAGVVGEREQLIVNASGELLEAAAGEIGAADAAGEEDVAAEDENRRCGLPNEDHVAGGVAGNFANEKLEAGVSDALALCDEAVGGGANDGDAEARREIFFRVGQFDRVAVADDDRRVGIAILERAVTGDVVAVAVRVEEDRGREFGVFEIREDAVRLQAGIDDEAIGPPGEREDVAVFLEQRAGNGFDGGGHERGAGLGERGWRLEVRG